MKVEIRCTRASTTVEMDVYPFYATGDRILCPRQAAGLNTPLFCTGCLPGYLILVKEVGNKTLLLDPASTIPPWTEA